MSADNDIKLTLVDDCVMKTKDTISLLSEKFTEGEVSRFTRPRSSCDTGAFKGRHFILSLR